MSGSIISIAGMMGSGKSTLARVLVDHLGWPLLPEGLRSRLYLNDLFVDEKRWAFDTQVSFLCEKAIRLKGYIESGQNIILDRSLFEDVEVFASHFYFRGKIDKRSYSTYKELADHFLEEIPTSRLTIYCECSLPEIERRLSARFSEYENFYPEGHISDIFSRYKSWFQNYKQSPLCRINSEKHDFRIPFVADKLGKEVISILTEPKTIPNQLILPGFSIENYDNKNLEILEEIIPTETSILRSKFKKRGAKSLRFYPTAYVAAPFTAIAQHNEKEAKYSETLFDFDAPHGIIKKGPYRKALNSISIILKRMGFSVILPHRDINKWGGKMLTPEEVFNSCTRDLMSCDLFIGLLGLSHGSHYEFGLAMGLNRPSIIIAVKDFQESFIAKGIRSNNKTTHLLKCDNLNQISQLLKSSDVKNFLNTFFSLEEMKR